MEPRRAPPGQRVANGFISQHKSHKKFIPSQLHNSTAMYPPIKTYTLAGFEPRSYVTMADAFTTAPRRQSYKCRLVLTFSLYLVLAFRRAKFSQEQFLKQLRPVFT
jgi:hypothetical protein